MANRKKAIIGVVFVLLILAVGFYLTKPSPNHDAQRPPEATTVLETDIGIIDINRTMREHPDYEKLTRLRKERNALAADAEDIRDLKVDNSVPTSDLAALEGSARQQRNQKLVAKQAELNERLKQKDIALRAQFSGQHGTEIKEIDDMYLPQVFNLQLKLDTLRIDKDAAEQIVGQINALKREHSEKVRDNQEKFLKQIAGLMKVEQDKAMQELQAYVVSVDNEIGADLSKKQAEIEARNHLAMAQKTNEIKLGMSGGADLQQKLLDKEKAFIELEEAMQKGISGKVAKIAIEHKLTTVLASVKVNIKAMDITDLVIQEFKK